MPVNLILKNEDLIKKLKEHNSSIELDEELKKKIYFDDLPKENYGVYLSFYDERHLLIIENVDDKVFLKHNYFECCFHHKLEIE